MAERKNNNNQTRTFMNGENREVEPIIKIGIDGFFGNIVKKDFESLQKKVYLATTPRVERLHLMHSVFGHACAGHGEFYEFLGGKKVPVQYKNITIDDVIREIPQEDRFLVKRDRQELINQITEWVYDRVDTLANPVKEPSQEDIRLIKIYREKNVPVRIEPLAFKISSET